ncbi:MAG: pyridoxal phosphate-dependent aminotransferase [Alphaproteobacteria bacterium]
MSKAPLKPSRRAGVAPFLAMDVLREANARAAGGDSVLHLEIGQPFDGPPESVLEAIRSAMASGPLGYTEALGIPALRARIARYYGEEHNLDIAPGRIAVTTGTSAGLIYALLALFDEGARVALGRPWYPAYPNILKALGLKAADIPLDPATGYRLDEAALSRLPGGAGGILSGSPANPTGAVLEREDLKALEAFSREHGAPVISDEIYQGIHYGEPAPTALADIPDAVVVNGFSKFYCMTGWRIGWMVLPEQLVRTVERLAQNLSVAPPTPSQYGALAAFEPEAVEICRERVARYGRNRSRLLATLREAGFRDLSEAAGAFYVYAGLPGWAEDSGAFCRALLAETGIAMTPGGDFDRVRGHRTVRLCFAASEAQIGEACDRLTQWAATRQAAAKV